MNTDNFNLINQHLSAWYKCFSQMHVKYTPYFINKNLMNVFETILNDKKQSKQNKELVMFSKMTKKDDLLSKISFIVMDNMTGYSPDFVYSIGDKNETIEEYLHDIRTMINIIQHCVNIMEYLQTKYDFVYIETWRNKEVIQTYVHDAYLNQDISLDMFRNAKNIDDLVRGHDSINKVAYTGLIITTYIKFMSEDIIAQMHNPMPSNHLLSHEDDSNHEYSLN